MFARTVAVLALLAVSTSSLAAGDAVAGKKVAMRCARCHSFVADKIKEGPSLFGIVGRKAGTAPRFLYSPAMRDSGIVWTAESLDTYLKGPKSLVLGNHMGFAGVPRDESRANLIAYLETLK